MKDYLQIYLHFIENTDENAQWNSEFSYNFSVVIKQIVGYSPILLSNIDVYGAQIYTYQTVDDLVDKNAVIFILSSKVKDSDFEFIHNMLPNIALSNVFLVYRLYNTDVVATDTIKALPSYNFFDNNPYNLEVTEFLSGGQGEISNQFWNKITDLAYDVKLLCSKSNNLPNVSSAENTIFLAEVSGDQAKNREKLLRELLLSGYRVLPEKPLPSTITHCEMTVADQLSQCVLSINIMGEAYGDTPTESDYSYVEIQNRMFTKLISKISDEESTQHIQRIVWFPPVFEPFDDKQIQYLKRLKKEIVDSNHTELIHSSLNDLKDIVDEKLTLLGKANNDDFFGELTPILLISDQVDSEVIVNVEGKLRKQGVEYVNFTLLHKETSLISLKFDEFKRYSNFLIVSTKGNNLWANSITSILIRSKSFSSSNRKSTIGLLLPEASGKIAKCANVKVIAQTYNKSNLDTALTSLISSITI